MGTVLVVEDSSASREIVMRILRRQGYNVLGAASASEALDVLGQSHPDLMLLDVMMPEMDGLALLQKLKADRETREVPVILLTALSDEERMKQAKKLGAEAYLVKTRFSYDELLDHVRRHVPDAPIPISRTAPTH